MSEKHRTFDRWGMGLSTLCAIHCLMGSLFVFFMPAFATFTDSFVIHVVLFFLIVPVAFIALHKSWRSHRQILPIVLASIGVSFLLLDLLSELDVLVGLKPMAVALSLIGSSFLFLAHLRNFRICHKA